MAINSWHLAYHLNVCGVNMKRSFMPFDRVDYTGNKTFKDEHGKPVNIKGVVGEVQARVGNSTSGYVVDFDGDGFVMDESVLQHHRFSKQELDKEREVEVRLRRKRYEDD